MASNISGEYKVGDRLAISHRFGGWIIYTIDKITPSGRIVCGNYTLNPDLSIRGPEKWGPYRAYPVTEEIERSARRREYLMRLGRVKFDVLPDSVLEALVAVLDAENR